MERDTRRRRPEEPERRPAPQRRRRNKRSPLSNSMLYIVMVCAVSIVLAAVGWSLANDMLALNKDKVTATIVVDDENDFGSVVDQLKDNDIIKYKGLFRLFSALSGGSDKFAQGDAIELVGPDVRPVAFTAPMMADETGAPLEEPRHPQMKFQIQLPCYAPPHSFLRACRENS